MTVAALLRHLTFAAGLAALSAVTVRLMIAARLMDRPTPRKAHAQPTPKGGGAGIVVAFLVGIALLYRFAEFARLADPYFLGVIGASVAIAIVAFLDDVYDWSFSVKLCAQLLAAAVAVGSGLYVHGYHAPAFIGVIATGWLAPPTTLFWIVFATNAMNFIDGLDGLAGGVAFVAAAFLAGIAAAHEGWFAYAASLLLAAGIAGFLPFNFPRARIFMGDVGSQFCGFMLAMLAVVASRFQGVELSFLLVPMLLSGVLFDVTYTLLRRGLAGESVTSPHRGHLYQIAQRAGVPAPAVAMIHWGFTIYGGLCCLLFIGVPSGWRVWVPALTLLPQLAWLAFVRHRARLAGITRWG
ncbi:MAG TPA: MraY family glycosyltransferase [Acetobacteraceae bacterium]|nr:MraY family glycosyltransferase [Acetobacteraceae bacterium]